MQLTGLGALCKTSKYQQYANHSTKQSLQNTISAAAVNVSILYDEVTSIFANRSSLKQQKIWLKVYVGCVESRDRSCVCYKHTDGKLFDVRLPLGR